MLRFLSFVLFLCACGDDGAPIASDAGPSDAGASDGGDVVTDAGTSDAGPPADAGGDCPCAAGLACVRGACIDACGADASVLEEALSPGLVPLAHFCLDVGDAAFGVTGTVGLHTARVVARNRTEATVRVSTIFATGGEPPFTTSDHDVVVAASEGAEVTVAHPLGLDARDGYPLAGVRVRDGDVDREGIASISTWSTFPVTGFAGGLSMGFVQSTSTDWHDWIVSARDERGEAVMLRHGYGTGLAPFVVGLGAHPGSVCAVGGSPFDRSLVMTAVQPDGSTTLFLFTGVLDPAAPLDALADARVTRVPDFETSEIVCSPLGIVTRSREGFRARAILAAEGRIELDEPRVVASSFFERVAPIQSYGGALSPALAFSHPSGVLVVGTR